MKSKGWLLVVWFLAGLTVGIVLPGKPRPSHGPVATVASGLRPPAPGVVQAPLAPAPAAAHLPEPPVPAYRERLRKIAEVNSLLNSRIAVSMFNHDELNETFLKVYDVTPDEVARLKAHISAAKTALTRLEAEHAAIKPTEGGGYSISIPPFPEEGGRVYDDFLQGIRGVLGDERFDSYRATVSGDADSDGFGRFGLNETTIDVRPAAAGTNGEATGGINLGSDGTMRTVLVANPAYIRHMRPEIYRKMVAAGLWKEPPRD